MNPARAVLLLAARAALVVSTAFVATAASATPAEDAERAALSRDRATIDSTYSSRLADCQARFVVTSCVEDAKRDRRQGLDALRARQLVLDEQRRKERSSARLSELSVNAAEQARRDAARAERPADAASQVAAPHDAPSRTLEPRRPVEPERPASASKPRANASTSAASPDRATKEARARATFDARKKQAAEHREEAERSAAKRAKQRPAAAPLPIPGDVKPAS